MICSNVRFLLATSKQASWALGVFRSIGLGNVGLTVRALGNPCKWGSSDGPGGRVLKSYSKARTSAVLYCYKLLPREFGGIRKFY